MSAEAVGIAHPAVFALLLAKLIILRRGGAFTAVAAVGATLDLIDVVTDTGNTLDAVKATPSVFALLLTL